jgi:alkaline phosphatase D
MRIAFTSCTCTRLFADQPVWDWIAAQQPDRLLLLGDMVYTDIGAPEPPAQMGDDAFAQHLWALYGELLAQPQFRALVQQLPAGRVHSLWDDHDFLWNDANGADERARHSGKIRIATAFQEAFRRTLAQGLAPGSYPASYNDSVFWDLDQPPLSTPSIAIAPDVLLHLSDGRSHRTRTWLLAERHRTMFGAAQRDAFAAAIAAAPADTVHLWASGTTLAGYKRYAQDWDWLRAQAATHRTLVLSGDIHRNELDAYFTGGLPLHEATASGAAVRDAVVVGRRQHNHGIVDIADDTVTVRLYRRQTLQEQRVLDRATWLPRA